MRGGGGGAGNGAGAILYCRRVAGEGEGENRCKRKKLIILKECRSYSLLVYFKKLFVELYQ